MVGPGRAELAAAMGPSSVVLGLVLGQDQPQVPLAEDQLWGARSLRGL